MKDPGRRWNEREGGRAAAGLLIGLAATALIGMWGWASWPNALELKFLDVRHRHFSSVPAGKGIAVIVIDDSSLEQVGRWPWPRRYLANLIGVCREAGAKRILLDMNLPEPQGVELFLPGRSDVSPDEPAPQMIGTPELVEMDNDRILQEAIQQGRDVTLPFYAEFEKEASLSGEEEDRYFTEMLGALRSEGGLQFEEAYLKLRAGAAIENKDLEYYQYLRGYQKAKAVLAMRRFGFSRAAEKIAIPMYSMSQFTPPIARLGEVIADSGFVTVVKDSDGVVRRIPLAGRYGDRIYRQFVFSAACEELGISAAEMDLSEPGRMILYREGKSYFEIPLDEAGLMLISWTGDWQKQLEDEEKYLLEDEKKYLSVARLAAVWENQEALKKNEEKLRWIDDLRFQLSTVPEDLSGLDAQMQEEVKRKRAMLSAMSDPELLREANRQLQNQITEDLSRLRGLLKDKIVLVGSIATGAADDMDVTPCNKTTPGIVVHYNILNTIFQWAFLRRCPMAVEFLATVLLGMAVTFLAVWAKPVTSGAGAAALILAALALNFSVLFRIFHLWMAVVAPVGAMLAGFTLVTFYRVIVEGRSKRQITTRFKQYISPALVDQIVDSPRALHFAGEVREISCFFSDLAGFTTISERLGPEKTVRVLNVYLDRMTEVLDRHGATINKFQGDGIFAFFGAPVSMTDHAIRAARAAMDAQKELEALMTGWRKEGGDFPELKMRIGLSAGDVVVGDCGSHRKFDYTAIGDTVNLGARLESANKFFGTQIMVCENVHRQVKEEFVTRYLGSVRVVGKRNQMSVFELVRGRGEAAGAAEEEYLCQFEAGVYLFQAGRMGEAQKALQRCGAIRPGDKGAAMYLGLISEYLRGGVPGEFDGGLDLKEK